MKLLPEDTIAWCAGHPGKDLRVVGVSKRAVAASRLKGLLRANGISPLGFAIEHTITVPRRAGLPTQVCRALYTRAEQRHPVFLDNRDTLMGEAIGTLVIYDMTRDEAARLMGAVRSDMNQHLAADASVQ